MRRNTAHAGGASEAGTVTVRVYEGEHEYTSVTATASNGTWSAPALPTPLPAGEHTFTAVAYEPSSVPGNNTQGESHRITFTVDTEPPKLSLAALSTPSRNTKPTFAGTDGGASSQTRQIVVRVSGSDNILASCRRELGSAVGRELEGAAEEQFWLWVSDFEHSINQRHRNGMIIYTHVPIQDVAAAAQALEKAAPDYNFVPAMVGRAGTGNLVMGFVPLPVDPPSAMQYANCASEFRGLLPPGSSAMVVQCPQEAKSYFDVWGSTPTDLKLMREVKHALDPKNILNRGRFIV